MAHGITYAINAYCGSDCMVLYSIGDNMNRIELQHEIWRDLGYLECKTNPDYQRHLNRLSDKELFKLWMNIHNAKEAYNNG